MRYALSVVVLVLVIATASPAAAQLRENVSSTRGTAVRLYDAGGTGFSLNRFFSPQNFRMGHSVEFMAGGGFAGGSMGMYTNSMMWQFSQKLAGRVDVGVAYSPTQNMPGMSTTSNNAQVFLRNAELAYRPSENVMLHLSVRRSPYGNYMSPYGYSPYQNFGYARYDSGFGRDAAESLFWKDAPR